MTPTDLISHSTEKRREIILGNHLQQLGLALELYELMLQGRRAEKYIPVMSK